MSDNAQMTPAEILVASAIKAVGKREVLKAIEKLFGLVKSDSEPRQKKVKEKKERKPRQKSKTPEPEQQCVARVKGVRSGIKVGRHVLFEAERCDRKEIDGVEHLCAVHSNQVSKFESLPFGKATEMLTEEQKKMFVEA